MNKKIENILQVNRPGCRFGTYLNETTFISSIYLMENSFVKSVVDFQDYDKIVEIIEGQNLTLIFISTLIEIEGNTKIQEYIKPVLIDSKLNIKKEIKIGEYKISIWGDIKNEKNLLMQKGKYHSFNQPFYSRVIFGKDRILCPTENEYLEHYDYLLSSLKKFVNEPYNFFPWNYLKSKAVFRYQANFYFKNEKNYSDILQISRISNKQQDFLDAIVIMMNPGSRKPINSETFVDKINTGELVDCIPDDTQYQIAELMEKSNWKKVLVINLLDLCEIDSNVIYKLFCGQIPDCSIFNEARIEKLNSIFEQLKGSRNIIIGWGVSSDLNQIKSKALDFIKSINLTPIGWKNKFDDFYHPWPRENEEFRKKWPHKVYDLLNK